MRPKSTKPKATSERGGRGHPQGDAAALLRRRQDQDRAGRCCQKKLGVSGLAAKMAA